MAKEIFIGTSGWHYNHWIKLFYPLDVTGYRELTFHAQYFNSVENNSSFYRIAGKGTYKTWARMTPDTYRFSMKLNKFVTHEHSLEVNNEVIEKVRYILQTTQVLGNKLGAILIQMPASFKYNISKLDIFLEFFTAEVRSMPYVFDIAIELRNKYWFTEELYSLLRKYNVALVIGQSSRWPEMRQTTADIAYIRMHGPEKLFSSLYSTDQLRELTSYITQLPKRVKRVYVYFNNDFHGYAIENAKELRQLVDGKEK